MLKAAVLCSHRAPGLLQLLNGDLPRRRAVQIVCVISSEHAFAEEVRVERRGVPVHEHAIRDFFERRGANLYHDRETRIAFDRRTLELLEPYAPDLLILDGYLYLVTEPLLDAFDGRMLNLHFSDLTLRLPDGRPRFPGLRAVRDALAAGQSETCATVHLVDAEPDEGAPIICSWRFPVSPLVRQARIWNAVDMFKAYSFAHEQWMMRAASGPLVSAALALIAGGRVDLRRLAERDPASVTPWTLDESGIATPPASAPETVRKSTRDDHLHPHAA